MAIESDNMFSGLLPSGVTIARTMDSHYSYASIARKALIDKSQRLAPEVEVVTPLSTGDLLNIYTNSKVISKLDKQAVGRVRTKHIPKQVYPTRYDAEGKRFPRPIPRAKPLEKQQFLGQLYKRPKRIERTVMPSGKIETYVSTDSEWQEIRGTNLATAPFTRTWSGTHFSTPSNRNRFSSLTELNLTTGFHYEQNFPKMKRVKKPIIPRITISRVKKEVKDKEESLIHYIMRTRQKSVRTEVLPPTLQAKLDANVRLVLGEIKRDPKVVDKIITNLTSDEPQSLELVMPHLRPAFTTGFPDPAKAMTVTIELVGYLALLVTTAMDWESEKRPLVKLTILTTIGIGVFTNVYQVYSESMNHFLSRKLLELVKSFIQANVNAIFSLDSAQACMSGRTSRAIAFFGVLLGTLTGVDISKVINKAVKAEQASRFVTDHVESLAWDLFGIDTNGKFELDMAVEELISEGTLFEQYPAQSFWGPKLVDIERWLETATFTMRRLPSGKHDRLLPLVNKIAARIAEAKQSAFGTKARPAPVSVIFHGPAGTGKSTYVQDYLVPYLSSACGIEPRLFSLNTGKHAGHYTGEEWAVYDELGATKNPRAESLIDANLTLLVSGIPAPLPGAAVDQKTQRATFSGVFFCTNQDPQNLSLGLQPTNMTALRSRWIEAKVTDPLYDEDRSREDQPHRTPEYDHLFIEYKGEYYSGRTFAEFVLELLREKQTAFANRKEAEKNVVLPEKSLDLHNPVEINYRRLEPSKHEPAYKSLFNWVAREDVPESGGVIWITEPNRLKAEDLIYNDSETLRAIGVTTSTLGTIEPVPDTTEVVYLLHPHLGDQLTFWLLPLLDRGVNVVLVGKEGPRRNLFLPHSYQVWDPPSTDTLSQMLRWGNKVSSVYTPTRGGYADSRGRKHTSIELVYALLGDGVFPCVEARNPTDSLELDEDEADVWYSSGLTESLVSIKSTFITRVPSYVRHRAHAIPTTSFRGFVFGLIKLGLMYNLHMRVCIRNTVLVVAGDCYSLKSSIPYSHFSVSENKGALLLKELEGGQTSIPRAAYVEFTRAYLAEEEISPVFMERYPGVFEELATAMDLNPNFIREVDRVIGLTATERLSRYSSRRSWLLHSLKNTPHVGTLFGAVGVALALFMISGNDREEDAPEAKSRKGLQVRVKSGGSRSAVCSAQDPDRFEGSQKYNDILDFGTAFQEGRVTVHPGKGGGKGHYTTAYGKKIAIAYDDVDSVWEIDYDTNPDAAQMAIVNDINAPEFEKVKREMLNNLVEVRGKGRCLGLMLNSFTGVTPAHLCRDLKELLVSWDNGTPMEASGVVTHIDKTRELALFTLMYTGGGVRHGPFKQLSTRIINMRDIETVETASIIIPRRDTVEVHNGPFHVESVVSIPFSPGVLDRWRYDQGVMYYGYNTVNTLPGDCGAPVVAKVDGAYRLVGIHAAKRRNEATVASVLISNETLKEYAKALESAVPSKPESHDYLEDSYVRATNLESAKSRYPVYLPPEVSERVGTIRTHNYFPHGPGLRVVGSFDTYAVSDTKGAPTKIYPSKNPPFRTTKVPTLSEKDMLTAFKDKIPIDKRGKRWIGYTRLTKLNDDNRTQNLEEFRCLGRELGKALINEMGITKGVEPLSLQACIAGDGPIQPFRRTASNGSVIDTIFKTSGKKSIVDYDNDTRTVDWKGETGRKVLTWTKDQYTMWKRNQRLHIPSSAGMKSELLPEEKLHKKRAFMVMPLPTWLNQKRLLLPIQMALSNPGVLSRFILSYDPLIDSDRLVKMFYNKDRVYASWDFSSFDFSCSYELLQGVAAVCEEFYKIGKTSSGNLGAALSTMMEDVASGSFLYDDTLLLKENGVQSGMGCTSLVDSIAALLGFYKIFKDKLEYGAVDFLRVVGSIHGGDDCVISLPRSKAEEISIQDIVQGFNDLGMTITTDKKEEITSDTTYTEFRDISFVSRTFLPLPGHSSFWISKLKEQSLAGSLTYSNSNDSREVLTQLEELRFEMFAYGRDKYIEYVNYVRQYAQFHALETELPDYDTLNEEYWILLRTQEPRTRTFELKPRSKNFKAFDFSSLTKAINKNPDLSTTMSSRSRNNIKSRFLAAVLKSSDWETVLNDPITQVFMEEVAPTVETIVQPFKISSSVSHRSLPRNSPLFWKSLILRSKPTLGNCPLTTKETQVIEGVLSDWKAPLPDMSQNKKDMARRFHAAYSFLNGIETPWKLIQEWASDQAIEKVEPISVDEPQCQETEPPGKVFLRALKHLKTLQADVDPVIASAAVAARLSLAAVQQLLEDEAQMEHEEPHSESPVVKSSTSGDVVVTSPAPPNPGSTEQDSVVLAPTGGVDSTLALRGGTTMDLLELCYTGVPTPSIPIGTATEEGTVLFRAHLNPWGKEMPVAIQQWANMHMRFTGSFIFDLKIASSATILGEVAVAYVPTGVTLPQHINRAMLAPYVKTTVMLSERSGQSFLVTPTSQNKFFLSKNDANDDVGEIIFMAYTTIQNTYGSEVSPPAYMVVALHPEARYTLIDPKYLNTTAGDEAEKVVRRLRIEDEPQMDVVEDRYPADPVPYPDYEPDFGQSFLVTDGRFLNPPAEEKIMTNPAIQTYNALTIDQKGETGDMTYLCSQRLKPVSYSRNSEEDTIVLTFGLMPWWLELLIRDGGPEYSSEEEVDNVKHFMKRVHPWKIKGTRPDYYLETSDTPLGHDSWKGPTYHEVLEALPANVYEYQLSRVFMPKQVIGHTEGGHPIEVGTSMGASATVLLFDEILGYSIRDKVLPSGVIIVQGVSCSVPEELGVTVDDWVNADRGLKIKIPAEAVCTQAPFSTTTPVPMGFSAVHIVEPTNKTFFPMGVPKVPRSFGRSTIPVYYSKADMERIYQRLGINPPKTGSKVVRGTTSDGQRSVYLLLNKYGLFSKGVPYGMVGNPVSAYTFEEQTSSSVDWPLMVSTSRRAFIGRETEVRIPDEPQFAGLLAVAGASVVGAIISAATQGAMNSQNLTASNQLQVRQLEYERMNKEKELKLQKELTIRKLNESRASAHSQNQTQLAMTNLTLAGGGSVADYGFDGFQTNSFREERLVPLLATA